MKKEKHRIGCGYAPNAPSGLIEHSKHGLKMEQSFESKFINAIFEKMIRCSTNDSILNLLNNLIESKTSSLIRTGFDSVFAKLEIGLFGKNSQSKHVFLGSQTGQKLHSALGGFYWELMKKYVTDWKYRQDNHIPIEPPKRIMKPLKKTYTGWKHLRDEIQPEWKIFPDNPKTEHVKIFNEDQMSPYERIERIIQGKDTDRVGFGPYFDWAVPFLGGSNNWKFCYDGIETGWACLNLWIRIGGCDFLPNGTGVSAYTVPYPTSHSRFFYNWNYPEDHIVPQFIEKELLKSYADLDNFGFSGLIQQITKRMIRDTFILFRELLYQGKVLKYYFGPVQKQFFPYSQGIFDVWDTIPMWRGMVPFMKDLRQRKQEVIEVFHYVNKTITDFMINLTKLIKAKTILFGNSRGSNSWVSPKMFEEVFWPSMKYSFNQCFENNIVPMCHLDNNWTENMEIFADRLPKRSCIFHLDQVDLCEVRNRIGDHFCLMGGMSPALLVGSSAEKVEEETKRYIENVGTDGLIVASGCEYPADTPIQNIYAQKRAIKKYGFFKK